MTSKLTRNQHVRLPVFCHRIDNPEVDADYIEADGMASFSADQNGTHDHILRPRAVKPGNPMVLRAQSQEGILKPPSITGDIPNSGLSR